MKLCGSILNDLCVLQYTAVCLSVGTKVFIDDFDTVGVLFWYKIKFLYSHYPSKTLFLMNAGTCIITITTTFTIVEYM